MPRKPKPWDDAAADAAAKPVITALQRALGRRRTARQKLDILRRALTHLAEEERDALATERAQRKDWQGEEVPDADA